MRVGSPRTFVAGAIACCLAGAGHAEAQSPVRTLRKVVATGENSPVGGQFVQFVYPFINQNRELVFWGLAGSNGDTAAVYHWSPVTGVVQSAAATGDPIPGAQQRFTNFGVFPSINGTGQLAFRAWGWDAKAGEIQGIWVADLRGGVVQLHEVAKNGDQAPGTSASFVNLCKNTMAGASGWDYEWGTGANSWEIRSVKLIDADGESLPVVAFRAELDDGRTGLWVGAPGSLQKLVCTGDVVGGLTVTHVEEFDISSSGTVAVTLMVDDGSNPWFRALFTGTPGALTHRYGSAANSEWIVSPPVINSSDTVSVMVSIGSSTVTYRYLTFSPPLWSPSIVLSLGNALPAEWFAPLPGWIWSSCAGGLSDYTHTLGDSGKSFLALTQRDNVPCVPYATEYSGLYLGQTVASFQRLTSTYQPINPPDVNYVASQTFDLNPLTPYQVPYEVNANDQCTSIMFDGYAAFAYNAVGVITTDPARRRRSLVALGQMEFQYRDAFCSPCPITTGAEVVYAAYGAPRNAPFGIDFRNIDGGYGLIEDCGVLPLYMLFIDPGNQWRDGIFLFRTPPRGDFDEDGVTNSNDISAFLTAWNAQVGSTTQPLSADWNDDGVVNSNDISAFLADWQTPDPCPGIW